MSVLTNNLYLDHSLHSLVFWVLTSFLAYLVYKWLSSRQNLPPGPYGLPFFGYIPFLGDDESRKLTELSQKYGSIFSLRLGPNLVVVLNDYDALKEVMSNPNSLDRPLLVESYIDYGFGMKNGIEWKQQRKATLQTMKDLGIGETQWEQSIRAEVDRFAAVLESEQGRPFDFVHELRRSTIRAVMSLLIGRDLESPDELRFAIGFADLAFSVGSIVDLTYQVPSCMKLLAYFQSSDAHKKTRCFKEFRDFIENEISKHKISLAQGTKKDFIGLYLEKAKNANYLSESCLAGNVSVMYLGAVDTTHTTLTWLFRLMAKYPQVQQRVQKELDDVFGKDGTISCDARAKTPYVVAVIMETLRYSSIEPITSARSAVSDFEVRGHLIPKGTQITANLRAIHFDPKYWQQPDKFEPERFLRNAEPGLEASPPSYAPFSFGKRKCPGEKIAWMQLWIFFSMVCRDFTIAAPPGEAIHFDTVKALVHKLKPQPLCFIKRNNLI